MMKKALMLLCTVCILMSGSLAAAEVNISDIQCVQYITRESEGWLDADIVLLDSVGVAATSSDISDADLRFYIEGVEVPRALDAKISLRHHYVIVVDLSKYYTRHINIGTLQALLKALITGMPDGSTVEFVSVTNEVSTSSVMNSGGALSFVEGIEQDKSTNAALYEGISAGIRLCEQARSDTTVLPCLIVISDCYNNPNGVSDSILTPLEVGLERVHPMPAMLIPVIKSNVQGLSATSKTTYEKARASLTKLFADHGGRYKTLDQKDGDEGCAPIASSLRNYMNGIFPVRLSLKELRGSLIQSSSGEYSLLFMYNKPGGTVIATQRIALSLASLPLVTPEPAGPSVTIVIEPKATGKEVREVQDRLIKLGFTLARSGEFDQETQNAMDEFCRLNKMGISDGVASDVYELLMSSKAVGPTPTPSPSPTPGPTPTPDPDAPMSTVFLGAKGDEVRQLQYRLLELGYFNTIQNYRPTEIFDLDTQNAVNRFCDMTGLKTVSGITQRAYDELFGNNPPTNPPTPTPAPTPTPNINDPMPELVPEAKNETVRDVQRRLRALGYFAANYEPSGVFDTTTQLAADAFCELSGLPLSDGMSQRTYDLLYSSVAITPTPSPVPPPPTTPPPAPTPPPINPGDSGDAVTKLQNHLRELGYYTEESVVGVYDEATQNAQNRFCVQNNIALETGASASLQETILASKAVYVVPKASLSDTLRNFMLGTVTLLGVSLPTWIIIAVCVALIVLIIVLILVSRDRKHKEDGEDSPIPEFDSKFKKTPEADPSEEKTEFQREPDNEKTTGEAGIDEPTEGPPSGARSITVDITYDGISHTESLLIIGRMTVGRGQAQLKLSPEDKSASRQHCELFFNGQQLMVYDYSSLGTLLNGVRIPANVDIPVNSGSELSMGRHKLVVRY